MFIKSNIAILILHRMNYLNNQKNAVHLFRQFLFNFNAPNNDKWSEQRELYGQKMERLATHLPTYGSNTEKEKLIISNVKTTAEYTNSMRKND